MDQPRKEISTGVSSDDVVLSVRHVSKKFCRNLKRAMFYGLVDIGGELVGNRKSSGTLRKQEFWAIDDVSFELRKGEALGLVGANGAGKTTLLKIISGLIKPNNGEVRVRGRIAPLIALGAGFNPILSGRENISINMSILGLTSQQIKERFDKVVEFAEIGHAIDAPVQTYSSGMSARLGFSCAIHTDPDILLIDEVLAVGDMNFRIKCYRKLAELQSKGASFILVSHSAASLLAICKKSIWLAKGVIVKTGNIESILLEYENSFTNHALANLSNKNSLRTNSENDAFIHSIGLKDGKGKGVDFFSLGTPSSFEFKIHAKKQLEQLKIVVIIRSNSVEADYNLNIDSSKDGFNFNLQEGNNNLMLEFPYCGLKAGSYTLKATISGKNHYVIDAIESFTFVVKNSTSEVNSTFFQPRNWDKLPS